MKHFFPERVAFLALFVGLAGLGSVSAQSTATPDSPKGAPMPSPILDNDEMTKLQTVRAQVLSANPDLKTEEEHLKTMHDAIQHQLPAPTDDQKNAAFAEWKAYQKKMRAAMLKIDPTLSPLFAKLDEARKHGGSAPFQPAPANKTTD